MTRKKKNRKTANWDKKHTQNNNGTKAGGGIIDNKTNTASTVGQTGQKTTTYVQSSYTKSCHKGNTVVYKAENGSKLEIGGWNNGATFDWNTHVIDLTGLEHKYWDIPVAYDEASKGFLPFLMQAYAGWLSLPFPDYGTPKGLQTLEQWVGIADTIKGILDSGHDVLVACHGGHGRSGLFCSIVGYLLNIKDDPTWASPVEKIRQMHCDEAVETYAQEKFVYDVLGLRLQPKHYYDDDPYYYGRYGGSGKTMTGTTETGREYNYNLSTNFASCPICGTQSLFVQDYGMCMTCRNAYESTGAIPEREDLTLKDIEHRGFVEHKCDDEKCMGIWKASKCGHVVHNQLIYEGFCETCYRKYEDDIQYAEEKIATEKGSVSEVCAMCGKTSAYSEMYGVCHDCSEKLVQNDLVTEVHCSITDPYKFITHQHCEDEHMCVGVIRADVCKHVVHNREVEDGQCPKCFENKFGKELKQYAL